MAVINFFKDSLNENDKVTIEVKGNQSLKDVVTEFIYNHDDIQYVEAYDPDTGKTEYIPIEAESYNVVCIVDGVQSDLNCKLKKNSVVNIMFYPASQQAGEWTMIGGGLSIALGITLLATGMGAIAGGILLTSGIVALAVGGVVKEYGTPADNSKKIGAGESESLLAINGAGNEDILGKKYPFIFGKRLINPYIVGSPYHVTNNALNCYATVNSGTPFFHRVSIMKYGSVFTTDKNPISLAKDEAKALADTDLSGDHKDLGQYFQALYCVGYGPLKLTDLRIGDTLLSYNRASSIDPSRKTILHGTLKGTSKDIDPETTEDKGDILNKWINNDVEVEILQAGDRMDSDGKWGSVYPVTVVESPVEGGNLLFAYDKELADLGNSITYKGVSIPVGFKTNSVRFSASCPYRIEVEVEMPGGLFSLRDEQTSEKSKSVAKYRQIPIHLAVQWRYSKLDEKSSDAENPEGWNTFDYETVMYPDEETRVHIKPVKYNTNRRLAEISLNKGLSEDTTDNYNNKWIGEDVFALNSIDITAKEDWEKLSLSEAESKGIITLKKTEKIDTYRKNNKITPEKTIVGKLINKLVTVYEFDGKKTIDYYELNSGYENDYQLTHKTEKFIIDNKGKTAEKPTGYIIRKKVGKLTKDYNYDKDHYNMNARRYTFVKEFTPSEVRKIIDVNGTRSDFLDSIEVRVIRLTPCYLDQTEGDSDLLSPFSYQDLTNWTYLRTWTFDKKKYTEAVETAITNGVSSDLEPSAYPERPISEEDLNRFCYVAVRLKQDVAETGGSSLEKFNLIASALQPKFDILEDKWSPTETENGIEELNIVELYSYWHIVIDDTGKKSYVQISFEEYEKAIETPKAYQYFKTKYGTSYTESVRNEVFDEKWITKNSSEKCYPFTNSLISIPTSTLVLSDEAIHKYETQNTASAAVFSLIGDHLKGQAKTFEDIELGEFGELFRFCNDITDGSQQAYIRPELTSELQVIYTAIKTQFNTILTNPKSTEILELLREAPENAVFSNIYDHYIEKLLLDNNIEFGYYNKYLLKYYLAETQRLGNPDGKLHIQYNCNGVVTNEIKLEELFSKILLTGRSYYRRSERNRYEPVIGRPNPYPVTVLNQRNVLAKSNTRTFNETISGYQCHLVDENDNYETNDFYTMDDGEDPKNPTKRIVDFQLDFVTNPYQLNSLARFNLATILYQRETYSRTIGYLGYALGMGDMVLLQDDSLLVGTDRGGRVREILEDEISIYGFIIDEPFNYLGKTKDGLCTQGCTVVQPGRYGPDRCVTLRLAKPNTSVRLNGKQYKIKKGLSNLVLFDLPILKSENLVEDYTKSGVYYTYTPHYDDLVAFGDIDVITTKAVVMSIKPKDGNKYELQLVPYNDELYNFGEKFPQFKNNMTTSRLAGDSFAFEKTGQRGPRGENGTSGESRLSDLPTDTLTVSCTSEGITKVSSSFTYNFKVLVDDSKQNVICAYKSNIPGITVNTKNATPEADGSITINIASDSDLGSAASIKDVQALKFEYTLDSGVKLDRTIYVNKSIAGDTGTARILSSLDETGYQDEVGIYKGRVYVYNEGWHIANTDSYLGSYNTIPPFQLDAFFYCSANFILDNALLKTKDGKYVVTKSGQYLTVKKQFEKDFIYLCTNEGWIKVSDKKDYRYIIAMQDKLTATGELPASIDEVVQDKADAAEDNAKEFATNEAENAKNKAIEESSKNIQSQLQAKVGTYLGMKTESPSSANNGDYFLLNNQDYADDNGYLFKYNGTIWQKLEPTSENYLLYMTALKDVMSITNAPVGAFSTLFANILMANSAVIGQLQTQVISLQNGGCIQSSNYNTAEIEVLDADSFEWVPFSDNCRGIRILKWGESEETIEYFQTTSTSSTPPYYNIYYYPVVVFDNNPDTVITENDEIFSSYTQKSDAKYLHIAYRVTSRGNTSISSQQTFDTNLLYGEIGFKIDDTGKAKFNSDVYIGGNSIIGGNTTIKGFIDNNAFKVIPINHDYIYIDWWQNAQNTGTALKSYGCAYAVYGTDRSATGWMWNSKTFTSELQIKGYKNILAYYNGDIVTGFKLFFDSEKTLRVVGLIIEVQQDDGLKGFAFVLYKNFITEGYFLDDITITQTTVVSDFSKYKLPYKLEFYGISTADLGVFMNKLPDTSDGLTSGQIYSTGDGILRIKK